MLLFLICFVAGVVVAIPLWLIRQRSGALSGLQAASGLATRGAAPGALEPVVLHGRMLPELARAHVRQASQ
jgi:hypothetical protein